MARRGRPPVPTELKLLRGNPGKRPINQDEPTPDAGRVTPPDWLEDEAKKEWRRVAPLLRNAGILSEIDEDALASYCSVFARWKEAQRKVAELGMVVKSPNKFPIQNPYLAIANKAFEQCQRMMTEFGMTPSSRSRVAVKKGSGAASAETRKKARFFGAARG